MGVAFVSALVANEAAPGTVSVVEVQGVNPQRTLWMARDVSRPASRAQAAFWDYAFAPENDELRERISEPNR